MGRVHMGIDTQSEAAEWGALAAGGDINPHGLRYDWFAITKRVVSFDGSHQALEQDLVTYPVDQQRQFSLLTDGLQKRRL